MKDKKGQLKLFISLFLIIILNSLSFVSAVESINKTPGSELDREVSQSQTEEIGNGLYYNIWSGIFKWFSRITESIKSTFIENVKTYEEEREKNRGYYRERSKNINKSYENESEPPYSPGMCPDTNGTVTVDTKWNLCTCGDGICASYENKCRCPKDCGSCPKEMICKRGECLEFIPNTCMNTVCEEGENETCPWDCNIYMQKEEEEIIKNDTNIGTLENNKKTLPEPSEE